MGDITQVNQALILTDQLISELDQAESQLRVGPDLGGVAGAAGIVAGHREAVGGPAASTLDLQTRVAQEIPLVMAVSVGIVVLVLLLTSHAWLEPAVLLLVLAVSILINMGTNFIFESVSFITFAVCRLERPS